MRTDEADARPVLAEARVRYGPNYGGPRDGPFIATMPFKNHRTVAEVWENQARKAICGKLGK